MAVVALPNFRKFNTDQSNNNSVNDLVSLLKTAQNNAQYGVKCPSDATSSYFWAVTLDSSNPSGYYLWDSCPNSSPTPTLQPPSAVPTNLVNGLVFSYPVGPAPLPVYPGSVSQCSVTISDSGLSVFTSGPVASYCPCFLAFKGSNVYSSPTCYTDTTRQISDAHLQSGGDGIFKIKITNQGSLFKCIQVNKGGAIQSYAPDPVNGC